MTKASRLTGIIRERPEDLPHPAAKGRFTQFLDDHRPFLPA
jgi:hypothetical protein